MVNAPQISLKVIVIAHLVLTIWAGMTEEFLPTSYLYMHAFILAFGVWSIISPDAADAVLTFLMLNVGSIVMDIIFLGIKATAYTKATQGGNDLYRFSLGMAIVNLLLKPFSSFVLFRLYQTRAGQYSEFTLPGMPGFGQGGSRNSNYEDIDHPVPTNNIETAGPHHSVDSPKLTP